MCEKNQPIKTAKVIDKMKNNTSIITLTMYVDLLRRASTGFLPSLDELSKTEKRAAKELMNSGLITEDHTQARGGLISFVQEIVLTPEGATSLESWSSYLRQEKYYYKFGDALLRFLWVIVGAIAASLPEIFKLIFT